MQNIKLIKKERGAVKEAHNAYHKGIMEQMS